MQANGKALVLDRDAIFHVLMGSDMRIINNVNHKSATRVCQYTKTNTALFLVDAGTKSVTHARAVFIVLLHADPELRREIVAGTALDVATMKMCEYRATSLFTSFFRSVLHDWLCTEKQSVDELVQRFECEYLAC